MVAVIDDVDDDRVDDADNDDTVDDWFPFSLIIY
jgi:hypothetical protein